MRRIQIPKMLGLTKVEKKVINLNIRKEVKIPKGGLTWEQRVLRDEFEAELRLRRERPKGMVHYERAIRKAQVRHEVQIGCIRAGFTFYKTIVWFT